MNNIHSAHDAPSNSPVSEIIRRLMAGGNSNPVIQRLIEADGEARGVQLANALRAAKTPELGGQGTSYVFPGAITDRAKGQSEAADGTVQRVALHGHSPTVPEGVADRATVAENRANAWFADVINADGMARPLGETVQPLSVKNSKNNGCTGGSESQPSSASRLASPDNVFAPPPSARSTREDNQPCTASFPPSPVQEIIAEECGQEGSTTEPADIADTPCLLPNISPRYCRCDFFDNGPGPTGTGKSKRAPARFKANLFIGSDKRNFERYKLAFLSEPRYFKRSTPAGYDAFYDRVRGFFDELRKTIRTDEHVVSIAPVIAHLKDEKNHVVPGAAAVLFQLEGECPDIVLFLYGSKLPFQLDKKPKGSAKCAALKAFGYWNREK